jgi:hypothetical protein
MVLQPLASVLTRLYLGIDHSNISTHNSISDGTDDNKNDSQLLTYLLPFRSLTYLSLSVPSASLLHRSYEMNITSSFIKRHWNKLDYQSIRLLTTPFDLVRVLRECISFSTSLATLLLASMGPCGSSNCENDVNETIGIKWRDLPSFSELDKFLNHMETSALLITSSSTSSSMSTALKPRATVSLECTSGYGKGEAEALKVQSFERDLYDRIKSRNYINMSSFTVQTYLNIFH